MNVPTSVEGRQTLCLDGEMTIYRAAELKTQWITAVEAAAVLDVDLSGVTDIDCAGVQLLLLAARTADERQHAMHVSAMSAPVREALDLLDLLSQFGADADLAS